MTRTCTKCEAEFALPLSPGPLAVALAWIERRGALCKKCKFKAAQVTYLKSDGGKSKRRQRDVQNRSKINAATNRWRKRNPERVKELDVQSRYKLTPEARIAMGNACAVCGDSSKPQIDHDHNCCPGARSCGKCVRDILCISCNTLIGKLEAVPGRLAIVQGYLDLWKATY